MKGVLKAAGRKERRIGILFVITRLAVGGAPRNVLATIQGLDRSRYRIALVAGRPEPNEGSLAEAAHALDIDFHILPSLQREVHVFQDLKALWQLYRFIRRGRYHIVHTHISKAGILGRLAAHCAGVPRIVHTYHGDIFEGYFGPLRSAVFLAVERLAGLVTDRFVMVSKALQARYRGYRVGRRGAFFTVPNGIWIDSFPSPTSEARKGRRVGTAAMFYPIKRVDLFLEVAHRVLHRRSDAEFMLAGGGPEEATLRQIARDLGDPVRFLGVRYDVSELLSTLDVFVLCSDFEGAGIGVMEAMLAGVPVVATRVGAVSEAVTHGETGFLVPQGDVDGLAASVLRLLEDSALRKRMGSAGRQVALKRFSAEDMVRRLEALYCALLKEE